MCYQLTRAVAIGAAAIPGDKEARMASERAREIRRRRHRRAKRLREKAKAAGTPQQPARKP
jgi:hypothetical protein